MGKPKRIDAFLKKKGDDSNSKMSSSTSNPQASVPVQRPSKMLRIESQIESVDISTIQHDPGLRPQISEYPVNQQDEIRRAYLKDGPHRFIPSISSGYPFLRTGKNRRRFQSPWYKMFDWLEYFPTKDAAYCLSCYLFNKRPTGQPRANAFTIEGFRNWKKG